MSECVVRMKMPKCCEDCAAEYDCMACGITGTLWYESEEFNPSNGRLPDCPILCQLPEGHGRLVDADAAYKAACEGADNWDGGCSPYRDDCIREEMDKVPTASPWHRVEDELPEPNIQCLVRDDDNNCAVGYYRQDVKAWDSPFFGWVERDDEYYEDGDLCRIGKVVAWMPIEPPKEDA